MRGEIRTQERENIEAYEAREQEKKAGGKIKRGGKGRASEIYEKKKSGFSQETGRNFPDTRESGSDL